MTGGYAIKETPSRKGKEGAAAATAATAAAQKHPEFETPDILRRSLRYHKSRASRMSVAWSRRPEMEPACAAGGSSQDSTSLSPASRVLAVADMLAEDELRACAGPGELDSEDGSEDSMTVRRPSASVTATTAGGGGGSVEGMEGVKERVGGRRGYVQERRGRRKPSALTPRTDNSVASPAMSQASSDDSWRQVLFSGGKGVPTTETLGDGRGPVADKEVIDVELDGMSVAMLKAKALELKISTKGLKREIKARVKARLAETHLVDQSTSQKGNDNIEAFPSSDISGDGDDPSATSYGDHNNEAVITDSVHALGAGPEVNPEEVDVTLDVRVIACPDESQTPDAVDDNGVEGCDQGNRITVETSSHEFTLSPKGEHLGEDHAPVQTDVALSGGEEPCSVEETAIAAAVGEREMELYSDDGLDADANARIRHGDSLESDDAVSTGSDPADQAESDEERLGTEGLVVVRSREGSEANDEAEMAGVIGSLRREGLTEGRERVELSDDVDQDRRGEGTCRHTKIQSQKQVEDEEDRDMGFVEDELGVYDTVGKGDGKGDSHRWKDQRCRDQEAAEDDDVLSVAVTSEISPTSDMVLLSGGAVGVSAISDTTLDEGLQFGGGIEEGQGGVDDDEDDDEIEVPTMQELKEKYIEVARLWNPILQKAGLVSLPGDILTPSPTAHLVPETRAFKVRLNVLLTSLERTRASTLLTSSTGANNPGLAESNTGTETTRVKPARKSLSTKTAVPDGSAKRGHRRSSGATATAAGAVAAPHRAVVRRTSAAATQRKSRVSAAGGRKDVAARGFSRRGSSVDGRDSVSSVGGRSTSAMGHRSSTVGNLQVRSRRSVVNAGRTSIGVGAPRAMKNKAGSKSRGGVGSRGASRPRLSLSPPRTKLSSHGMAIAAAAQRGTAVSSASGQVSAASGGAATGSATGNAVPKRNPLIRGSSPPRPPRVSMSRSAAAQAGAAKTSAKRAAVLARRTEGESALTLTKADRVRKDSSASTRHAPKAFAAPSKASKLPEVGTSPEFFSPAQAKRGSLRSNKGAPPKVGVCMGTGGGVAAPGRGKKAALRVFGIKSPRPKPGAETGGNTFAANSGEMIVPSPPPPPAVITDE